jgi:glycosyltransferase involved in cell wall biosynthesis
VKILFISHEASNTGAPLFLLHICKYLKQHTSWKFYFLLKQDGPLHNEFAKIGNTYVYNEKYLAKNVFGKLKYKLKGSGLAIKLRQRKLIAKFSQLNLDLIYSNTATNGALLYDLSFLSVKIITHVHELAWAIDQFGMTNVELVKNYTSYYISTSPSVTAFVKEKFNPVRPVFEINCFPIHKVPSQSNPAAIKVDLGIPVHSFVVGASGTVEWRKGWDLFVRLAWETKQLDAVAPIYFIWIGGMNKKTEIDLQHEIKLTNLENNVLFIGHRNNPMEFYAAIDVFCLLSREEAFGIVAIESAQYGTPIICFDSAKGLASFVQDDAGVVISYPNTRKMAESVLYLAHHRQERNSMGQTALERVVKQYNIERQGDLLINYLQTLKQNN